MAVQRERQRQFIGRKQGLAIRIEKTVFPGSPQEVRIRRERTDDPFGAGVVDYVLAALVGCDDAVTDAVEDESHETVLMCHLIDHPLQAELRLLGFGDVTKHDHATLERAGSVANRPAVDADVHSVRQIGIAYEHFHAVCRYAADGARERQLVGREGGYAVGPKDAVCVAPSVPPRVGRAHADHALRARADDLEGSVLVCDDHAVADVDEHRLHEYGLTRQFVDRLPKFGVRAPGTGGRSLPLGGEYRQSPAFFLQVAFPLVQVQGGFDVEAQLAVVTLPQHVAERLGLPRPFQQGLPRLRVAGVIGQVQHRYAAAADLPGDIHAVDRSHQAQVDQGQVGPQSAGGRDRLRAGRNGRTQPCIPVVAAGFQDVPRTAQVRQAVSLRSSFPLPAGAYTSATVVQRRGAGEHAFAFALVRERRISAVTCVIDEAARRQTAPLCVAEGLTEPAMFHGVPLLLVHLHMDAMGCLHARCSVLRSHVYELTQPE